MGFPVGSMVKNLSANAGDTGLIPGSGRYPGEEIATHSNILAWKIPQTDEPGGLQSMELQRVRYDWAHTYSKYIRNSNNSIAK